MKKDQQSHRLDLDFFEYVIAFNCTFDEIYLASVTDVLKLDYISNNGIKDYLQIVTNFFKKHSKCPSPTEIKQYLTTEEQKISFKKVVQEFKQLDRNFNQDELYQNTEQYLKERSVYHAVKQTVDEVTRDNAIDSFKIFERFEDACTISLIDDLGFDYFKEVDKHIKDLTTVEKYISTGYKWLDKILGGGFLESGRALYNFTGATNSGKSIMLGNLAANIVDQGYTVVIITLEMSEMVYAKRISAKLTGVPIYSLAQETNQLKSFVNNYKDKNPNANLIIKEFPPSTINANHIRAFLKKLVDKRKIKIGAIVLDYLTLLQAINPQNSLYADGKNTAEQIRALSYPQHFGCPVITAGQTNRSGYEENPKIDSTGESIGIPQTVDFQGVLWSSDEDKELGVLHCGIQKSRFGANRGQHAFRIDYDTLSIEEAENVFGTDDEVTELDSTLDILSKESK